MFFFFFSSRRRHTRLQGDWSSDVCSSDLRLGADGVDLLMSDSTNAEVPGIVTSERDIAPVLADIFASATKRIIVACFASHVHRVQQVLDTAAAHGRKVALVGRSMVRNMGVARDLGYLRIPVVPGGLMVDLKEAEE